MSFSIQNNGDAIKEEIIHEKTYQLPKDNYIYEIKIYEKKESILIKSSNYEIELNPKEISKLFELNTYKIDDIYNYVMNIFNKNKVLIKDIIKDNKIKLILNITNNAQDSKIIEIDLIHINQNKDYIIIDLINKYNKLEKEVLSLRNEFKILKDKVLKSKYAKEQKKKLEKINSETFFKKNKNILDKKESNNNLNEKEILNIKNNGNGNNKNLKINITENDKTDENNEIEKNDEKNIELKLQSEITTNSFCSNMEDNTFCIFNSFDKTLYLIYSTKGKSIISYNLYQKKILKEITDPHEGVYITNYRHCILVSKDIIMSISLSNNLIKIWEFPIFSCILTLNNINSGGNLYSACFLNNVNSNINERYNYIITSSAGSNDPIKIFDFDGNIIKKFEHKNSEDVYFIDSYFDLTLKKYFIITGNYNYIKSYDFYETKLYKKYESDDNSHGSHCSCDIYANKKNNLVKLIDICYGSENIYIWNFHSGELISKIITDGIGLVSCSLWDNKYCCFGCRDRTIKLVDINNNKIIQNLSGHNNWISCVKKIQHKEYGKCLISQGDLNDQIKLWVSK